MATELTPSRGNILIPNVVKGVPAALYGLETTQRYHFGAMHPTWDGRLFKYAKSSGACRSGRGNKFVHAILNGTGGIDYQLLGAVQAIGDRQVTFAAGTHAAFAKDELANGPLLISDSEAGGDTDAQVQNRVITGNEVSAANAACTVYFDHALTRAVTASTYAFCMKNEYSSVAYGAAEVTSVCGIAAAYVSASGYYHWEQTWGRAWMAPQADDVGKVNSARQVVFRHDGSLGIHDYANALEGYQQHAGFILDNNASANGGTFFFLQIDSGAF